MSNGVKIVSTSNKHRHIGSVSATMQGSKSIIRLRSGCPPLEVNNTIQKASDGKTGVFSVERCITYTMGKRFLSLKITEMGRADRVNVVLLNLSEENGKGSSANINLRVIRDDRYGVLCNINNKLAGSYDSFKENYCVPPLPDTELTCYVCRETGSGSFFTVAKKKSNMEIVDRIKATHAFLIDDELTYNVLIKITNNRKAGLSVEVEGPMKLTTDYTKQLVSTMCGKIESQMEASTIFLFKDAMRQLASNGNDKEIDGSDRQKYSSYIRSRETHDSD